MRKHPLIDAVIYRSKVQVQNRLTKPAQHRVQADVLPRSV
jgi:hypothetical protein